MNTKRGAVLGAVLGGVTGAVIGHQSGKGAEGAAIGAGVGGLLGGVAGNSIDEANSNGSGTRGTESRQARVEYQEERDFYP